MAERLRWEPIIEQAAALVHSYDTAVTLRQLFYRLVSKGVLPNTIGAYKALSKNTAEARRCNGFPELIDPSRDIHRFQSFTSPEQARKWLARIYRRDRTEGQAVSLYLGVEKEGMVEQLEAWFGDYGLPILALRGYASQTYADEVRQDAGEQGRAAVLIYAGDFDPSGIDIDRDFLKRAGCFDEVVRVALSPEQIEEYDLPPQPGKATDTRAKNFMARHGRLVQVELDALPPEVLRDLYGRAVADYWNTSAFEAVLALESAERQELGE